MIFTIGLDFLIGAFLALLLNMLLLNFTERSPVGSMVSFALSFFMVLIAWVVARVV